MSNLKTNEDDEVHVYTKEELEGLFKKYKCSTFKELYMRFWCTHGLSLIDHTK